MVPQKIGLDARFYSPTATGIGRHVYELIKQLALLDKTNQYTLFLKPEFANTPLPGPNFTIETTTAPHYSLAEQWGFWRQLERHKFDLMIFPHFNAPILYSRPFVVTIHDLTLHLFPGKKKSDFCSRSAYKLVINTITRKARHCFAVSENTKQDMIRLLKTPEKKITVTHNGVSPRFSPIKDNKIIENFKKEFRLPKKYFLYTGVSRSHKNIPGLIEAYETYLNSNPKQNIHLVLAGPIDETYTEIPELIKKYQLENRVHRTGFFPEDRLNELITGAIAYVFPTFYEGFGIPPLEAMQCGIPVTCSNTSSLPEACGKAAYYFDPHKTEEIAKALKEISENQELRKKLVQEGFTQCQKFSWKDMGEKMFQKYIEIVSNEQ